ncbi:MAG: pyrroline-5-carboxylate reductase [Betaproteobacteria bacterium AqS2]|uniref:Pyrroline-5-carboxylate reductase n=1 Tax=Candidatus Amphirhobacter heronislandensis TaxID=1732024 RepID=A0A930UHE1_9GAMM|nr:pyrroline-5-carboxylate reductase [Betaproteobacteria bacterium AqS2]
MKIAFIGGGVMASALLQAAARVPEITAVHVVEPLAARREKLAADGVAACATPADLPAGLGACLLCVKPQDMPQACAGLAAAVDLDGLPVISIAAGTTIARLRGWLGGGLIVRTMPNTPLRAGQGCTFACAADPAAAEAAAVPLKIFAAAGLLLWLDDERLLDAATALSGSGPAYVYLLIETMARTAREMGIEADAALAAAVATVSGAAAMAGGPGADPAELRRQVTSKGGTTKAALDTLEAAGFAPALAAAMEAARQRGAELAGEEPDA